MRFAQFFSSVAIVIVGTSSAQRSTVGGSGNCCFGLTSSSFFVSLPHSVRIERKIGDPKTKMPSSHFHSASTLFLYSITTRLCVITDDNNAVDIPILFENNSLLAINKPHGISYHDDPVARTPGIVSLLRSQRQRQKQNQQQSTEDDDAGERLYGVHRLDQVTSGILLFAKSPRVASTLMRKFASSRGGRSKEQEEDDGIIKFYFGISGKKPTKKKQGWVNGIMVKGRRGSYKLLAATNGNSDNYNDDDGIEDDDDDEESPVKKSSYASTRFYTAGLGHLPLLASPPQSSSSVDDNSDRRSIERQNGVLPKTAILFRPHTGKTHQLRVAAKSLGLPLLGDARYGGGRVGMSAACIGDIDRTYLHASAIHFNLDGESVTIWSPPPFAQLIASSDDNVKAEKTLLDNVFERMMGKHSDCQPIIDAIHASRHLNLSA